MQNNKLRVGKSDRCGSRKRGATFVEGVLILLPMLMIILFIMSMGVLFLTEQTISERAREAARYAAVSNWSSDQVENFVCYNQTSSPPSGTPGFMGLKPANVSYTVIASTTDSSTSLNNNDGLVQVKVSGVQVLTWIPKMAGSYTLPTVIATAPTQSQGATN